MSGHVNKEYGDHTAVWSVCVPVHQGIQGRMKLFNTNSKGEERRKLVKLVHLDVNIWTQNKGHETG